MIARRKLARRLRALADLLDPPRRYDVIAPGNITLARITSRNGPPTVAGSGYTIREVADAIRP